MDLQHELLALGVGNDEDIGLFTYAYLIADGVDSIGLLMRVEGEIIESAVRQTVAVI